MRRFAVLLVLSLLQTQTHAQVHIYDDTTLDKFSVPIEVAPVNPRQESLSKYTQENEVILIVNIASDPQYAQDNYDELQFLQESFRESGFTVLAFPCDQFGHEESKRHRDIVNYARERGATFPIFGTIRVNGKSEHELYNWLKTSGAYGHHDIIWNFEKFILYKGKPIYRFPTNTPSNQLQKFITPLVRAAEQQARRSEL